jgi:hypothetical protein
VNSRGQRATATRCRISAFVGVRFPARSVTLTEGEDAVKRRERILHTRPDPDTVGFPGARPRSRHDEGPRSALSADTGPLPLVEVPGIEPGSFVASSGLLRAQLTLPLLGPPDHVSKSG